MLRYARNDESGLNRAKVYLIYRGCETKVGPIRLDINPIAFTIFGHEVRWYGIFVALAVIVLVLWMARETKRAVGISYEPILNGALVAIPSGLIVSKLLHIIDFWDYYVDNPGLIFSAAGLTIYGAVLGAALGIWIYSRRNKYPFGRVTDLLAPGIILAQLIGRVGCTLNGCCYGTATSLPWGVIYTDPKSEGFFASANLPAGIGLHPAQVYEIIYDLIVFGVLFKLRGRLKPDGSLFRLYLILYASWRLAIGFVLREGTSFLFGMQQAQTISIIVLAITVPLMIYRRRKMVGAKTE